LEIETENPDGHTNLGLILLSQGDPDSALKHLHKALPLSSEKPLVWNNIGRPHYGAAGQAMESKHSAKPFKAIPAGLTRGGI